MLRFLFEIQSRICSESSKKDSAQASEELTRELENSLRPIFGARRKKSKERHLQDFVAKKLLATCINPRMPAALEEQAKIRSQ